MLILVRCTLSILILHADQLLVSGCYWYCRSLYRHKSGQCVSPQTSVFHSSLSRTYQLYKVSYHANKVTCVINLLNFINLFQILSGAAGRYILASFIHMLHSSAPKTVMCYPKNSKCKGDDKLKTWQFYFNLPRNCIVR